MVPTRSGESAIRGREGEQRRAPSESSPALRLSAVVHLSRRAVSVSVQGYAAGRRRFRALNGLELPRSVDLRNNEKRPLPCAVGETASTTACREPPACRQCRQMTFLVFEPI